MAAAYDDAVLSRGRIWAEIVIVLGLSLGASALYSVIAIVNRLTREVPIGQQTATLNPSLSARPVFDLVYQLMSIATALVPVALVCYLLWRPERPRLGRLGIDGTRIGRDSLQGLGLAAAIGIPGIGLYLAGRALGLGVGVQASALDERWWTVPVLLLSAFRAGAVEEIIVIGYLFARLGDLGWGRWTIILTSALLRATYHLYQGFPAFLGNFVMGVAFGWLYTRTGRVVPFVAAHTAIDAVAFVGYPVAAETFPELFGTPAQPAA